MCGAVVRGVESVERGAAGGERERAWGRCCLCRRWVVGLTGRHCGDCHADMVRYEQENRDRTRMRNRTRYVMVVDPTPVAEGGFRAGAGFSTNDVLAMLRFGSFTPGTVLADRAKEPACQMRVSGESGKRQRMIEW